jgi:hypothetical protein
MKVKVKTKAIFDPNELFLRLGLKSATEARIASIRQVKAEENLSRKVTKYSLSLIPFVRKTRM